MKTMNYGEMPSREEFNAAFERECPDGTYVISHGTESRDRHRPDAGTHTASSLWAELERLHNCGWSDADDSPWSWIADILGTLGFEWI